MTAMLMIPVYNLADTFFIGQTHDALAVQKVIDKRHHMLAGLYNF